MIRVSCPTCGLKLQVPPERAGGVVACSECGEQLRVPGYRPPPPPREPAPSSPPRRPPPEPPSEDPPGSLIFCYVCKKQVANNAPTCPKCGAVQTAAGREEGRRFKKTADRITSVVGVVILAPVLLMCLICGFGGSGSSVPPAPERWDMDRLKQDVNRALREPGKTIFIPADGSQPVVVPDPDAP
jgi:DNA-directed RNA polymerase subunit M/transcription elongation factor TFIIS